MGDIGKVKKSPAKAVGLFFFGFFSMAAHVILTNNKICRQLVVFSARESGVMANFCER